MKPDRRNVLSNSEGICMKLAASGLRGRGLAGAFLVAVLTSLFTSSQLRAEGAMGGESHHHGNNGPSPSPVIVPVPDFTPESPNTGDTAPSGPVAPGYPPSGPSRTDSLID